MKARMASEILRIALDVPLNRLFDYLNDGGHAQLGNRVAVSFAGRQLVGIVVDIVQESDVPVNKLKTVQHVFDDVVFDQSMFDLLGFCQRYYHFPIGQVMMTALPLRLRQVKQVMTRKSYEYSLQKTVDIDEVPKRQIVLRKILQAYVLQKTLTESQLAAISPSWRKAIRQLEDVNAIESREVIAVKSQLPTPSIPPTLNADQTNAVNAIIAEQSQFKPWLLYGVTGSGKTEVYIRLIESILQQTDKQVLILVPEINLTPQLEARFRSRLSQYPLVTLHSHLSESERLQSWKAASAGEAKIVIGTRLSVFTPLKHLSLIIIDEEHDASYKQQDGMRYHARDVAMVRAKQLNIPIVLGSATPSLETWHLVQKKQYGLLRLYNRAVAAAQMPTIHTIDIAKSPTEHGLSPLLINAIKKRLALKQQSLLFINRRGYAPVLHCNACQWLAPCSRCSANLVVHLKQRQLKCHHCGHEQAIPVQCPSCGNPDISPIGQATQRLEERLAALFPEATIARVDRDSIRKKDALTQLLARVHNNEVDILVGTQMLAKGHDFPNLTLVGVIETDTALYSSDFRASERLFTQLMQVSGRAGRGAAQGEVLIQTAYPNHSLFKALKIQDYEAYAEVLMAERQAMQFPPISYFALLKSEAKDYQLVSKFLTDAANMVRALQTNVLVYDPIRPQLERLNQMERGQLLLQAESRQDLQKLLALWMPQLQAHTLAKKQRWVLDIDPLEF